MLLLKLLDQPCLLMIRIFWFTGQLYLQPLLEHHISILTRIQHILLAVYSILSVVFACLLPFDSLAFEKYGSLKALDNHLS